MSQPVKSDLENVSIHDIAFSKLIGFTKLLNPHYAVAPHNSLVAEKLEAVERGDITRLMIFMPPRHGKSHLASENFPAWFLGRNPAKQIIYATYSEERAKDVGKKVRNYILDPIYNDVFRVSADPGSKSASRIEIKSKGGVFFAVGIGGAVTGRGAHLLLIDDPIKGRQDADSPTKKRQLRDWFTSVAYTRLMPGKSGIIVIMTRWTYDDLAGWLLEEHGHEGWEVISLPAIAEGEDNLGRIEGDALWPDPEVGYPVESLLRTQETLSSREWNALYQQRPLPSEGGLVSLDDFGRFSWNNWKDWAEQRRRGIRDEPPFPVQYFAVSWDTAFKEEEINDPSACTVWACNKTDAYLVHVLNRRLTYPKLYDRAINIWRYWSKFRMGPVPVLIEDRASGQSLIQDLKHKTAIPVIARKPDANKVLRFENNSRLIEAGRIHLPDKSPWLNGLETQVARFPFDKHDDIVDSISQFLGWFGRPRYVPQKNLTHWK